MKIIDSFKNEYAFLSNFYFYPMIYNGIAYSTLEHAYQAAKMLTEEDHETVRLTEFPGKAKKVAHSLTIRDDWDKPYKHEKPLKWWIMRDLIKRKFPRLTKNPKAIMSIKLIATEKAELIEGNWWNDTYWGVCNGKGENNLGQLLMARRVVLYQDLNGK